MQVTKEINPYIFRAYDIRGIADVDLTDDVVYTIGLGFGSKLITLGHHDCIIGRDNRLSSLRIRNALVKGLTDSGVSVIDLGLCTTPMYYYACLLKNINRGLMITASHNPKDNNGFKFAFDETGNACGEAITAFRDYLCQASFTTGEGEVSYYDIKKEYYKLMQQSITLGNRKIKAVIDCGNGTTSLFAYNLYSLFNIDLVMLYDQSDGTFPNHIPDPSIESNMEALKQKVKEVKADIGIAFDGDGDRVGIVTNEGTFLPADIFMIMAIRDVFKHSDNKKVLFDVKCSKTLADEITKLGGSYVCYRTGNSYTRRMTKEANCVIGIELAGHIYFRDKFLGFDSGMYAGLRLIEILSKTDKDIKGLLAGINQYYATPEIKVPVADDQKFKIVESVKAYAQSRGYAINDIDGVRVDFPDGWALVRASNTGPNITVRFEGKTMEYMETLKQEFMTVLNQLLI